VFGKVTGRSVLWGRSAPQSKSPLKARRSEAPGVPRPRTVTGRHLKEASNGCDHHLRSYCRAPSGNGRIAVGKCSGGQRRRTASRLCDHEDYRETLSVYFNNDSQGLIAVQEKPVQKKYGKALAEQAQEIDADTVVSGVVRWYQVTPRVVETGAFGVVRARYGARGELGERVKVRPVSAQGREIVNTELKARCLRLAPVHFAALGTHQASE